MEFWGGLLLGGVIGFILNWLFLFFNKEDKWDEQFMLDKQILNRFLEKVRFEINLIVEQIEEYEKQGSNDELKFDTLVYFRRLLNEDPLTISFGDKNFKFEDLQPVRDARIAINQLKEYVSNGQFNKNELIKTSSNLLQIRIKLISFKS